MRSIVQCADEHRVEIIEMRLHDWLLRRGTDMQVGVEVLEIDSVSNRMNRARCTERPVQVDFSRTDQGQGPGEVGQVGLEPAKSFSFDAQEPPRQAPAATRLVQPLLP